MRVSVGLRVSIALALPLFFALTSELKPNVSRIGAIAGPSISREPCNLEPLTHFAEPAGAATLSLALRGCDAPRVPSLLTCAALPRAQVDLVPLLSGCTLLRRYNERTADRPLVSSCPAQGPPRGS